VRVKKEEVVAADSVSFVDGEIDAVEIRPLKFYHDARGWLVELFRQDELTKDLWPVMTYVSQTLPGVARGPHEHVDQTDGFAFIGPSDFKLFLWDIRPGSARCIKPNCRLDPPGDCACVPQHRRRSRFGFQWS
jgi:dTDP-4-dehydrorhamnose 3,5-epimerase-like enzyme